MLRHLLALSVTTVLLAGCGSGPLPTPATASVPAETAVTANAEPAHDFSLPTLSGETVTLSEQRGQWVLLNFWATWCPPCVKEMPYLNRVATEREMVVWGVNFNEPIDKIAAFVADHGIAFPIVTELDDLTALIYQVRALPRTYVIAPDGTIARTIVGQIDPAEFDAWLDSHQIPHRQ